MNFSSNHAAWVNMIQRCENPKRREYKYYGPLGVRVHESWRNSFPTFLRDVGRRPSAAHSLDRFPDPNGNYEPRNVRWATDAEQARNRRNTRTVMVDGHRMSLVEAYLCTGVKPGTIAQRLRAGASDEEAVAPLTYEKPTLSYMGMPMTMANLAKFVGIPFNSLARRIARHGSPEAAIEAWRAARTA